MSTASDRIRQGLQWALLGSCATLLIGCGSAAPDSGADVRGDGRNDGRWTHAGIWTLDELGRVRITHGINLIRKFDPYVPLEFGEQDARFLASEGFTAARIGFIWEAVEPQPGIYDDAYIEQVAALDRLLARHGIRTRVDFHQDSWSREYLGDGAPAWASIVDSPTSVATVGSSEAFAHFWRDSPAADGIGIQTHFINTWRHVVPFLRDSDNIINYDLFNEPYPGSDYGNRIGLYGDCGFFSGCAEFQQGALADFYRRLIPAVREQDPTRLIFVEDQAGDHEILLPAYDDALLGLEYHVYCGVYTFQLIVPPVLLDPVKDDNCPDTEARMIDYGLNYAKDKDIAVHVGEFSADDTNDDNARMVDLMADRLLSWAIWAYYTRPEVVVCCRNQGLLIDDTRPGSQENAKQDKLDAIVVPYPVAVAGTPLENHYDRAANVMTLRYSTAPAGRSLAAGAPTRIFVPRRKYPTGYTVQVAGAHVISTPTAAWLELLNDAGASEVSVTLSPRSDATTDWPPEAE